MPELITINGKTEFAPLAGRHARGTHPDQPIPWDLTDKARAELDSPAPLTVWRHVAVLVAWLDAANPRTEHEIACRVMKLAEETGEAVAAYIGMTGQNPRKGRCATVDDLASELCDVIVTAMVALATIAGTGDDDAEHILQAHLSVRFARLLERIAAGTDPEPGERPGEWACWACGAGFFSTAPDHGLCPDCAAPDSAR